MINKKLCSKCDKLKQLCEFTARKDAKDGLRADCKVCRNQHNLEYYYSEKSNRHNCCKCNTDLNLDTQRVHKTLCQSCYRKQERAIVSQRRDKTCIDCKSSSSTKWYNGPTCRKCYRASNYAKHREKTSEVYRNKRIKNNLRTRLNMAIKNNQKVGSAVKDLGCSVEELKAYLESKFTKDMTWDDYGKWHIDHIKPLSSFDLSNPEELKKACHYSNLQPLWAKDNLKKSNKY